MFRPSEETLIVLQQSGFPKGIITEVLLDYLDCLKQYPDLWEGSDKDFVLYLRSKHVRLSSKIETRLNGFGFWTPSDSQVKKLIGEGYWREIIGHLLLDFVVQPLPNKIVVSKFGYFHHYLRRVLPLTDLCIERWKPNSVLRSSIAQLYGINENHESLYLEHFKTTVVQKKVPAHLIPRFYFNFVKMNTKRIVANNYAVAV